MALERELGAILTETLNDVKNELNQASACCTDWCWGLSGTKGWSAEAHESEVARVVEREAKGVQQQFDDAFHEIAGMQKALETAFSELGRVAKARDTEIATATAAVDLLSKRVAVRASRLRVDEMVTVVLQEAGSVCHWLRSVSKRLRDVEACLDETADAIADGDDA
jgi:hypothetical protein